MSVLKKGVRAVQWVDGSTGVKASLLMPDGTCREGFIEPSILKEDCDMVQLERIGFARIDKKTDDSIGLVFAHR